jgi:DNA-binding NarL/FixJ family response regulator
MATLRRPVSRTGSASSLALLVATPDDGRAALQILSVPRPEPRVRHLLSQAVLEVASSLLEGQTRRHIPRVRQRSERTVANQLGIAFKQLHAGSRLDLPRVLARTSELPE